MKLWKHAVFFIITLFATQMLYARGVVQDFAALGGQRLQSGPYFSSNYAQLSYPGARLDIYKSDCSTVAVIYKLFGDVVPEGNPIFADVNGYFRAFTDEDQVCIRMSGAGIVIPFTRPYITIAVPSGNAFLTQNVADTLYLRLDDSNAGSLASVFTVTKNWTWNTAANAITATNSGAAGFTIDAALNNALNGNGAIRGTLTSALTSAAGVLGTTGTALTNGVQGQNSHATNGNGVRGDSAGTNGYGVYAVNTGAAAGTGAAIFAQGTNLPSILAQSASGANTTSTVVARDNTQAANTKLFDAQNAAGASVASMDKEGDVLGTTFNKVTITAPGAGSTLTIANGKTATFNSTLTLAGTDGTVMTFPTTSASIARTDTGQTFTGTNTFVGGGGTAISATGSIAISSGGSIAGMFGTGTGTGTGVNGTASSGYGGRFTSSGSTSLSVQATSGAVVAPTVIIQDDVQAANTKMIDIETSVGASVASWDREGDILATTLNKITFTTPATAATLTIANNKTFTVSNTMTLAGTDATTMTFPTTNATIARTDTGQTHIGTNIFDGTLTAGTNAASGVLNVNGIAATARSLQYQTASSNRWITGANSTAEGGANAGSDWILDARSDAGADIGNAILCTRSTMYCTFGANLASGQAASAAARFILGPGGAGAAVEELRIDSGAGANGRPQINFMRNSASQAYIGVSGGASNIITGDAANELSIASVSAVNLSPDGITLTARVDSGGFRLPTLSPAGSSMTTVTTNKGMSRTVWTRYDWTNANVTALGAGTTGDVTVCSLPAKTIVHNAYVVITGAAGTVATLTVAVGRTAAAYIDYIVASDAKAAANTVYGDASGERGTNLTSYDLPSWTGTTTINAHFISTGGNLNTVTSSTGSVYLETETLP